jgi:hypothetical protein
MSEMFLKFIRITLLLCAVYLCGHLWFLARDGFSVGRIAYLPQYSADLEESREEQAIPLLNQSYTYLGRGRQCYAFVSADGKTILKIPRFDRYRLPIVLRAFSVPWLHAYRQSSLQDRTQRLACLLESFRIAGDEFAEYTGVLYVHLRRTNSLPTKVLLYDHLHRPFVLNVNTTVFALQKNHPLFAPLFLKELQSGNRVQAQVMLNSLLNLMRERGKRGLFNKDSRFLKNYSWDGEKCIQIDIGSFYRDPTVPHREIAARSFFQGAWPIRDWLSHLDHPFALQVEEDLRECWSSA